MHYRIAILLVIPFLLFNTPAFSKTDAKDVSFQGEEFKYLTDGDCPLPAKELQIIKNKIQEHVSEAYYYQHFDLDVVNAKDSASGCGYGNWHWVLVEAHYKYTIDGYSFPYNISMEWDEREDKWEFTDIIVPREITSVMSSDAIESMVRECAGARYENFKYIAEPAIRNGFTLLHQGSATLTDESGSKTYYFSINLESGIMELCWGGPYIAVTNSTTPIALYPLGCYGPDCIFSTNMAVSDAYIDRQKKSLVFKLPEFQNDTTMTVQISRRLIDAKASDGGDGVFAVTLDGERYPYEEIEKTEAHRTLMISSIPAGSKRLDIVGTDVIQTENISPSIAFDKPWYKLSERGILTVIDRSVNLRNDWTLSNIDTVSTRYWSSLDKGGLLVVLRETTPSSGIFQEIVTWTPNLEEAGTRLHVEVGGTITAQYGYLTTTATIISTNWPLNFAGPHLPEEYRPASNIPLGDDVTIDGLISSNTKTPIDFLYILQIKDSEGFTVEIFTKEGSISDVKPESTVSIPWKPNSTGTYEVTAFLWSDMDKPVALAERQTLQIVV